MSLSALQISTPWGVFQPGVTWCSKTVWPTMTVASYQVNIWLISCQRILVLCLDSSPQPSHLQLSALNHSTMTLPGKRRRKMKEKKEVEEEEGRGEKEGEEVPFELLNRLSILFSLYPHLTRDWSLKPTGEEVVTLQESISSAPYFVQI